MNNHRFVTINQPEIQRLLKHNRKNQGFSLIELMIVLAILGILSALAYPSYTKYANEVRRADAHLALLTAVQVMERCKTSKFSYATCTLTGTDATSPDGNYSIALSPAPTSSTYTLVATAINDQADDTDCTSLSITHLGKQTSKPGADNTDANGCWGSH